MSNQPSRSDRPESEHLSIRQRTRTPRPNRPTTSYRFFSGPSDTSTHTATFPPPRQSLPVTQSTPGRVPQRCQGGDGMSAASRRGTFAEASAPERPARRSPHRTLGIRHPTTHPPSSPGNTSSSKHTHPRRPPPGSPSLSPQGAPARMPQRNQGGDGMPAASRRGTFAEASVPERPARRSPHPTHPRPQPSTPPTTHAPTSPPHSPNPAPCHPTPTPLNSRLLVRPRCARRPVPHRTSQATTSRHQ